MEIVSHFIFLTYWKKLPTIRRNLHVKSYLHVKSFSAFLTSWAATEVGYIYDQTLFHVIPNYAVLPFCPVFTLSLSPCGILGCEKLALWCTSGEKIVYPFYGRLNYLCGIEVSV
uniref:Uncharacterized protein n=1 Tax=Cacopsylla melanoneura TaxID=428564 RepID=A0A8D8Y6F2_9HEMI